MKITEYLKNRGDKVLVSLEILPPLKGGVISDIYKILDPLIEFNPSFIDVTYHREEFIYIKNSDGHYEKTSVSKRPGTVGICASIMNHYGIEAVPHLICGGFSKQETENALIDLSYLGIQNILALRGDAQRFEDKFIPNIDGNRNSLDLVSQINLMNDGRYLYGEGNPTDFCIGVAGYPEKHFESPNLEQDIINLKKKVDAGAKYIVTQLFFDNQRFLKFRDECVNHGINVPIIPGLKPITKKYQLTSIPRKFFINIPHDLTSEITNSSEKNTEEIGIDWTFNQCKELILEGVDCLHFYTMSDSITTHKILSKLL